MNRTIKCYDGQRTVTYTDDGHGYYVHEKERSMPGVTTIIQDTVIKQGIPQWMVNVNNEYALRELQKGRKDWDEIFAEAKGEHRRIRDEAGNVGSDTHRYIEEWLRDPMKARPPVHPQAFKACQAFCAWYKQHKVKVIECEKIVYHDELGYCGTLDVEAEVDGERSIIDNKAASGFWREMPLQLGGYALALEAMTGRRYDHGWVNVLDKKTGTPVSYYVPLAQVKSLWPHCVTWYRALQTLDYTTKEIDEATKEGRRAWSKQQISTPRVAALSSEPTTS